MAHHSPVGLRIIGILKLVSAGLLVALALGIFHILGTDIGDGLEHVVKRLHLNPESKLINGMIADVIGISQYQLQVIDAATFGYAILYLVEGIGLLRAKVWAEYLTVIATASLLPFEIYELIHKATSLKFAVFAINVTIVWYLIYQLRRYKKKLALLSAAAGHTETPAPLHG